MRFLLPLLLLALPAAAADVDLKPVYMQRTPHQVLLDAKGKPWFIDDGDEVRDEKNALLCRPPKGVPVRFDSAGRLWWRSYDGLTHFDGKGWQPAEFFTGDVDEDAAGRVIAYGFNGRGKEANYALRVFDAGKWTAEPLPRPTVTHGRDQAIPAFRTHPDGRTWFWFHLFGGWGLKEPAAWSFDGKTWTPHTLTGRKEGEAVDAILPLADGWVLVVVSHTREGKSGRRAFTRSPNEKDEPTAVDGDYRGTDADGRHHFSDGRVLSADRTVRKATAEDEASLLAAYQRPAAVYDGKTPSPVLPFQLHDHDNVGPDADGRFYLRDQRQAYNQRGSWVLWPKHEKANQFLRPAVYPELKEWAKHPQLLERLGYTHLFADTRGVAFARRQGSDAVMRWDDKTAKWADTPIKPLPLVEWDVNRAMHVLPPMPDVVTWGNLREVGHACGADGSTLFVRVKTKYASEREGVKVPSPPKFGGGGLSREDIPRLPKIDPDAPFYQSEAWLHTSDGWSDPLPPLGLVTKRRKDLLVGFERPAAPSARSRCWR